MILEKHKLLTLYLFLLTIVASCASDPEITVPEDIATLNNLTVFSGDALPLYNISFDRRASYGDTESVFIGSISGVAVADDGTLFMGDRTEAVVHVYTESGEYQTAFGGKGEGPGEFLSASNIKLFENELFILDTQQQRISVFDPVNGEFLRTHPMGSGSTDISGFPIAAEPLSADRFFVLYNSLHQEDESFYRSYSPRIMDMEGNTLSSEFIDFPRSRMLLLQSDNMIQISSLPFMGEAHIGFNENEEVVTGFSDRFLFHVISLEGDTLKSVYHSKTLPPLNRAEMLANIEDETSRKEISAMEVPETKQAFESFYVDDLNRLWVSSPTKDNEMNEWWVLAENGEKLAVFSRPATDRMLNVKNDNAYFLETDEETGLQEVVKYSFKMEG